MPGVHCHIHDQTFGRSVVWVNMTHGDNGTNGTLKAGSQYDARLALRTLRCVRHIVNHSA